MAFQVEEFYPDYRKKLFGGDDIKGLGVCASGSDNKIGIVQDAIVDDKGRFNYLVIDLSFWGFGKRILLPLNSCLVDYNDRRVYVDGLSKEKVKYLPDFYSTEQVDEEYEEQVNLVYQMPQASHTLTKMNQKNYQLQR